MMKKSHITRFLSLVFALVLSLSLCVPAFAAGNSTELTEPGTFYDTKHTYSGNWASTTKFYLYANGAGGLTRVEAPSSLNPGILRVEEYDNSFRFLSGRLISYDGLPIWGGFYAGTNYNFIITGQNNPNESDSVEVVRVLKYSKDWQYLGKASVYRANTSKPFEAGTLNCSESGGILYIHTCHQMYKSSDGKNHQANMIVVVRESDMTVTETSCEGGYIGYVSHSFNQFIMVDSQRNLILVNHGDAYPRAIGMHILIDRGGRERPNGDTREADLFKDWNDGDRDGYVLTPEFPGKTGENTTGAMLGGLTETSNGYLLAYAQRASLSSSDPYQVKLAYIAKNDIKLTVAGTGGYELSSFQIRQITNGSASMGNPYLVPNGLSGGYVLWQSGDETISYTTYDANGQTGTVQTGSGRLSDCQPILYNGKVVWFVGFTDYEDDGTPPTFYTLDASGVTSTKASGTASAPGTIPSTPSTPAAPGMPSTPSLPSNPSDIFKDVAADHWAINDIRACVEQGIVTGVGDGRFDPDGTVSYAQLIVMMTRAFYPDEVSKVTDTDGKPWYYANAQVARDHKMDTDTDIVNKGGWPRIAVADTAVSRYEMSLIISNFFNYHPETALRVEAFNYRSLITTQNSLKDWSSIPGAYQDSIRICYIPGIIKGMEDGCFHGEQTMTRAQACAVIQRINGVIQPIFEVLNG